MICPFLGAVITGISSSSAVGIFCFWGIEAFEPLFEEASAFLPIGSAKSLSMTLLDLFTATIGCSVLLLSLSFTSDCCM